ncbi:hypothetical protein [Streptomyces sp. NBC_01750]|uniref:hypothetical protein n=1 Tax=Streptomyces sp. NBC_01750 TaxID=2975928 RepID=UPI002DDC7C41|nr:hypothetical protein [Streptomyces sp. NBC_01750]WSD34469.1 hypothetical protein OG966_22845 [Streptomyces sp. NBC_01750]
MELTGSVPAAPALAAAYEVIRQPLGEILPRLSATLGTLVPHLAAAELSTNCAHSPFKTYGDSGSPAGRITAAELHPLVASVPAGSPGRARPASPGPSTRCSRWSVTRRREGRCWYSCGARTASSPRPTPPSYRPCGTW